MTPTFLTSFITGRAEATLPGKSDTECDPQLGKPPDHCQFVEDGNGRYSASLLYKQFLPKVKWS